MNPGPCPERALRLPPPTTMLLLRHGAVAVPGPFGGRRDVSLSDAGRRQAAAAAVGLDGIPVRAVYTSDLLRCRHTAAPIGERLDLPVHGVAAFRERGFGAWEKTPPTDPRDLERLWNDPDFVPPGGESIADLRARVVTALTDRVARHGGDTVVVVSHGGPHRVILGHALDLTPQAMMRLEIAPGWGTLLQYFSDGGLRVAAVNLPPMAWQTAWRDL